MGNAELQVPTPKNSQLIIDDRPQMAFGGQSIFPTNDVVALVKSAKVFSVYTAQCGCGIACCLHGHAHAMHWSRTLPTGSQGVLARVGLSVRGDLT